MRFVPNDFIHPEDKVAREHLEAIPGFAAAVKMFLNAYDEQRVYGLNMAEKIRLGPRQLPEIYRLLPPVCGRLGIEEPEFYLEMSPFPNAYTFGDTRIAITVTSGLLEYLEEDEATAVVAHECGHILCRHVLYTSMATLLVNLGASLLNPVAMLAQPIRWGLLYWMRRSEFSADRAAAVVMGKAEPVVRTMIRLAGGPKSITDKINLELYMEQAKEYDRLLASTRDKMLQATAIMYSNHPFAAVRSREVSGWCGGEQFQLLMTAVSIASPEPDRCPRCGHAAEKHWKFCARCGTERSSVPPANQPSGLP